MTGESYAGHYIPAVTHHIWRTNKAKPEGERINLKGMAIGDGGCASQTASSAWVIVQPWQCAVTQRMRMFRCGQLLHTQHGFACRRRVDHEIQVGAWSVYAREKGLITAAQFATVRQVSRTLTGPNARPCFSGHPNSGHHGLACSALHQPGWTPTVHVSHCTSRT